VDVTGRRPFSELIRGILEDPERREKIDVMQRVMRDVAAIWADGERQGLTTEQIIDRLREALAGKAHENELYRAEFQATIEWLEEDCKESAISEE
jgi:hypothetical protein